MSEKTVNEYRNQKIRPAHSCERKTCESAKRPERHRNFPIFLFCALDRKVQAHACKQQGECGKDAKNNEQEIIGQVTSSIGGIGCGWR